MTYEEFINSKVQIAPKTGFDVADEEICTNLKPHQKIAVKWAIAGGRRAISVSYTHLDVYKRQFDNCIFDDRQSGWYACLSIAEGTYEKNYKS